VRGRPPRRRPGVPGATADLALRRQAFEARTAQYRALGYDRIAAARFVAGAASPLCGPAPDVGTGKGLLAVELARLSLDVVSVDIDVSELPLATALAREASVGGRLRFLQQDAACLPFRRGHSGARRRWTCSTTWRTPAPSSPRWRGQ
jgi:hypothetical protein